ncbi:unnamed protein product [Prorocentrum cordatum]|uniref:Thioredoxin domain-containing protein n=1 Tax=Prorocentrum cordatum TaxID=2364126 RepID=A0ABN9Y488_9DINO|nr:unnamed protein product [Polarella glacialis]
MGADSEVCNSDGESGGQTAAGEFAKLARLPVLHAPRGAQGAELPGLQAVGGGGSGGGGPQPGNNLRVGLLSAGCCAGAAGIAYLAQQTSGGSATVSQVDIRPMAEDVFENSDNLFVFFLERESDATSRVEDMRRIIKVVASEPAMAGVTWHYSVRKEGDPAVPDGAGPTENVSDEFPPLKVIMYKGQRKTVLRIGAEVPKDEIVGFFTPVSETLPEDANGEGVIVHRVSGSTFVRDVVAASVNRPVLLQMYEDTCFLCFLMRPFVNSLAELLREHKVPLTIKRLNIEKNDFPSGCPVARGTPTFVLMGGWRIPRTGRGRAASEVGGVQAEGARGEDLQGLPLPARGPLRQDGRAAGTGVEAVPALHAAGHVDGGAPEAGGAAGRWRRSRRGGLLKRGR